MDLIDKIKNWLENEVYDGAEIVSEYYNSLISSNAEDYPDGKRPKCNDGSDDIIFGRAECAESLLKQINKWQEENNATTN